MGSQRAGHDWATNSFVGEGSSWSLPQTVHIVSSVSCRSQGKRLQAENTYSRTVAQVVKRHQKPPQTILVSQLCCPEIRTSDQKAPGGIGMGKEGQGPWDALLTWEPPNNKKETCWERTGDTATPFTEDAFQGASEDTAGTQPHSQGGIGGAD